MAFDQRLDARGHLIELRRERAHLGAAAEPELADARVEVALGEAAGRGADLREHLAGIEIALIRQALARADGVVAHAAKILKLQRTTLVEKLRKYGMGAEAELAAA
jgi:sigma-54 specific flagellar transcriptional regulator A